MAKQLLQDMVKRKTLPPQKSTPPSPPIVEPVAEPEPAKIPEPIKVAEPIVTSEPVEAPEPVKYKPSQYSDIETRFASINDVSSANQQERRSKYALWLVALASALFLIFALSFLFSSAKITVTPKIKDIATSLDLSAVKDGTQGDLPFNLVVISGSESQTIVAGTAKDVSIPARGQVIIYNAYNSTPQALAIDTRLEGSNGKIYKTATKVTVPGMKGTTPGSVEVGIYAAESGAEYNSGPLDFKIFGFKGTPKYAKFYARSKGDITGGLKGKANDISDADKAQLLVQQKGALQDKLLKQAIDQIPSGFVLFKDGVTLDTNNDSITSTPVDNGMVTATLQGTLSGFLFEEKKLTQKVASGILPPNEDVTQVYIPNLRDLSFTLANQDNTGSNVTNINFRLSGNSKVVWKVDDAKLVNDMLGQRKSDFNSILSQYPNIDSAQLVIRPFWKSSLPTKASEIKVIVNYPQ